MNYRLDVASLIVDPKGFPLRELPLPKSGVHCEQGCSNDRTLQHIRNHLLRNWVLYQPTDMVELDFCLGEQARLLNDSVQQYERVVMGFQPADAATLRKLQLSLEEQLRALVECLHRAQFYEIPLELDNMYRVPHGIGALLYCCDSFRVLEALSEALDRSEEQEETRILVEDDESRLELLSEALLEVHEFTGGISTMFRKGWQPASLCYQTGALTINLNELAANTSPTLTIIDEYERTHKVKLSDIDRTKYWLFINILKHRGNIEQLKALLQFSIRVSGLDRVPHSLLHQQTLHTEMVRVVLNWHSISTTDPPQIMDGCSLYTPQLVDFLCHPSNKLRPQRFLNYAIVCCRTCTDTSRKGQLQKVVETELRRLLQSRLVIRYAEQIFYLYESVQLDSSELFQFFVLALKELLQEDTDWSSVDVFELERGLMHFFRWFLSESASSSVYSPYYKHIINAVMLSMLKKRMEGTQAQPTAKELRITHFLFNQSLYFSLQIEGFEAYLLSLVAEPEMMKLLVWIMRRLSHNNQLMFKMNFKFLHRLVQGVYSRGEETCMRNVELVQLYWETAAKFLMLWGPRSYLEEETGVLKQHYDMLLAKLVDLAPHLNKAHKLQEQSLQLYLKSREDYNPRYMKCWLSYLSFKQKTFFQHTIYSMVFVKEELSQNHLKSLLRFALGLCSPLTVCISSNTEQQEQSFFDDIDALTSEFALETLECVQTFLHKWKRLDLSWIQLCQPSFLSKLWQTDRREFICFLADSHEITADRFECLLRLRRLENNLQLYNNLMEKLNEQSREEFKIIVEIEKDAADICMDIMKQMWEASTRACVEVLCKSSDKLQEVSADPKYQLHYCELELEVEQRLSPNGSSFLCFERSHITNHFQFLRLARQLFDNTARGNASLFTKLTEQRIRLPLCIELAGKPPLYRIIGRCVELIRTIENYFVCASEQEKQIKCKEFIPLKLATVELLAGSFNFLTLNVQTSEVRDIYVRKLGEILVRQLKKYFTGFLLHDLLELNINTSDAVFAKSLNTHMNLHLSMLGFASAIYGFYEDTHSCYVEVLQAYANEQLLRPALAPHLEPGRQARKKHTCQFILSIFNMFLHSTFKLGCRVRSALFYQLIGLYEKLTGTPRRAFNAVILYYLRLNFQSFISFELTEDMNALVEGDVEDVERIHPMNIPKVAPVKTICTQAMVINLLSRNNFDTLLLGIKCIFANSPGVDCYLRYLVRVSQQLVQTAKIDETDLETIILDVFGSLETILEPGLEEASHKTVLSMLLQIFQLLSKTQHPLGQIRSNLTKHLTTLLFSHPTEQAMKQLEQIPLENSGGVVLQIVRCEYELAKTCRSNLHLLNCLYLDAKSTRFVRENWPMVVQNFPGTFTEEHAKAVFSRVSTDDFSDFLFDANSHSALVINLIDAFVKEFEQADLQGTNKDSINVYGRFKTLLGLMVKMPSLITLIVCHETFPSKLTFIDFMLERVLRVNYQMVAELVLVLLKTNGGFQMTADGVLLSQNFLLNCQLQQSLITIISDPTNTELLRYINSVKLMQLLLEKRGDSLFGLYLQRCQPKLPEKIACQHKTTYRNLRLKTLENVIKVIQNEPSMCRYLMSLLAFLLDQQLEDCSGYDLQQNLVYFMNQQLLKIFRDATGEQPKSLLLPDFKVNPIVLKPNTPAQPKEMAQQPVINIFVNRRYCVMSLDDRAIITRQASEAAELAAQLVQQNKIARKAFYLHEKICRNMLESSGDQDFPSGEAKLSLPNLEEEEVEEQRPLQQRFFQQDSLIMPGEQDDIIDDLPAQEQLKPTTIAVSSFEQLHEDGCIAIDNADRETENSPMWAPSIANFPSEQPPRCLFLGLLQSENNNETVFKRVQKLDLMSDLEMGVDISNKIQFLSNDELLKMIQVSDGRLLLGLQVEKQKRGVSKTPRPSSEEESAVRYLDELYVGCRNHANLQQLLKNGRTVIPELSETSLVNLLNEYLCAAINKPVQETACKVLTMLSMNNRNLCVLAQLIFFVLSLNDKQVKLLEFTSVGFPEPIRQLNRRSQLSECLMTTKSRAFDLLAELYQRKIGLPIWLYGQFEHRQLKLRNLPQLTVLRKASKLFEQLPACYANSRLLDLVIHNFATSKLQDSQGYESLVGCMRGYIDVCERKHHDGYPYHLVEELESFHERDVQTLATLLLREGVRASTGTIHNQVLRLMLQVYPNSYQPFMAQFIRELGDQLRNIMDDSLKQFRNFRVAFCLKPQQCQEINQDKDKLAKLVDSYLLVCKEKDNGYEKRLERIRTILSDICLDLVPWFREWRFQVENRSENYEFCCRALQLKKRVATYQLQKQFEEAEKTEQQRIAEQLEFTGFKCKKINEFLSDFLRPVHETISVGLLHGFLKAQELLEMMTNCFVPSSERLPIIAPAYRKISQVWQAVLAFGSLNTEEDGSCYHTMSSLQTREILKSKSEFGLKSSTLNFQSQANITKPRRSSVRLSIATSNPFNIDKLVQKFLKHTDIMATFIEEGSRLTPMLSRHGGLQVKLKTIRRKKSGTVREIEIDREKVWFDTLLAIDSNFVGKDIRIRFRNELGVDYGGLTKEWLTIITKQLFNPMFGLFELSANRLTIQPAKLSYLVPNHLMHFRKLGVLVGKALVEGWNLEINFTRSFLKHLLGCTIYVEDLQDIDPDTCRSLLWILENEIDESMEITFSYTTDILGKVKVVPLCENGDSIFVNESNKKEYAKALCKVKMTDQIREQSRAFMQGLESVIPYSILRNINYKELGVYLAGMPIINLAEMQQHAKYNGFSRTDKVVDWFWLALRDFDQEMLANFLFFLTGSFKVPYGGFKEYPIVLNRVSAKDHLPVAHTCFNTLDLSDYTDKKTLASKLLLSINQGRGFNVS